MKQQIENVINFIKEQDIDGCLTGSCLLDYFEGQDIDIFCYNEKSFTKLIYALYYNKLFLIIEPIEQWKFKEFTENPKSKNKKFGLITLKFKYNTCIDVNIILKENSNSIFDVLSSFDMNIISKGYDLKTKQYLDLSVDSSITKIADWNKWNLKYYDFNIWNVNQILRQFERAIKYYERGYNTDNVVIKYKEIIEESLKYENIFNSQKITDKINNFVEKSEILLKLFDVWLINHNITTEEKELLKKTILEI